jgi:periplasmic divalent cation tolerance protein
LKNNKLIFEKIREKNMKMYYITLNNDEEAQRISHDLLGKKLAVCTNWMPITCAYRWQGEIKQGAEIALIVKTQDNRREAIESVIAQHITYTNCIAEIEVPSANHAFLTWLETEMN